MAAAVDLYWLPLGAGGRSVALNGRIFEAAAAWRERRPRCALYHAALEVRLGVARHVVEMAPAWSPGGGAVASGPVGVRCAGRLRLFRYEIRCWRDGTIPDVAEAVASPQRLSTDPAVAVRLLGLAPRVPRLVWGRDERRLGDMWNSNSVVAWLLEASGAGTDGVRLPAGGRAPGWDAGIAARTWTPTTS